MIDVWYSLKAIQFSDRNHILWLIRNLGVLKVGDRPKQPPKKPDGIEEDREPIGKAHIKTSAYFTDPIHLAAEIEERLDICGFDGQLVELVYRFDKTHEELARRYRMTVKAINFRIEAALTNMTRRRRNRYYDRYKVVLKTK